MRRRVLLARRTGRGLILIGFVFLCAAFIVRTDREGHVALVLAAAGMLELGGLIAILSRRSIAGLRIKPPTYAYALSAVVAGAYIALTLAGNPNVRGLMASLGPLKLLAVVVAAIAGVFEETVFRAMLMDRLARAGHGRALQVALSGLAFGGLHFYAFAGVGAAVTAQVWTTMLGFALGALYLVSRRSLWPCIGAHVAIDAVLEPALLLSFFH